MKPRDVFETVVVGPGEFAKSLENQGATAHWVDWTPPLASESLLALYRDEARMDRISKANEEAVGRLLAARCRLTGVGVAGDVISGLESGTLLHAGPPLDWSAASGPLRGALIGAVIYEGWATDHEQAESMLSTGRIMLSPCHEHDAVGPMAGVISPSMPVFTVVNEIAGNQSFSTLNEGLGRVLRYGANDQPVLDRLTWLAEVCGPALGLAVARSEGLDLTSIMAQALQMGDELHNRNKAATALFTRQIAPPLLELIESGRAGAGHVSRVLRYLADTDVFFLNLAMAACKAALDSAAEIPDSTLVTCMARNGTEFGIRTSGTGGHWFTAPSPEVDGLFFPGFGPEDANPDLGDSAITETGGLGGFALAAAPAIVQFVGGSAALGREVTEEMFEITMAQHPVFQIPAMDFRGTPVGIDTLRVCRTGLTPVLDTGIAHKEAGVGQIGAGMVRVPAAPFVAAAEALIN